MPTPQRLPIVNSDDGTWGDIIRQYLKKEHYDDGTDNAVNGGHQNVTIRPGTATAGTAPLKFTSGTLLSTPEAGAMEYNTNTLYFTISSGPTRKKVPLVDDGSPGATGDVYYRDSSGSFARLGVGSSGQVLTVNSGIPAWLNAMNFAAATKSSAYTITSSDAAIFADATTGNVTITLPGAGSLTGYRFYIKRIDNSANTVTISPATGTIDGVSSLAIGAQNDVREVVSDGTTWYVLSSIVSDTVTASKLRLTATDNVSLASTTHGLQIGADTGLNLAADTFGIQARFNGFTSNLWLNDSGGTVNTGSDLNTLGNLTVGKDVYLTSGALLSTPQTGAMEFDTDSLYFTITTGATRKKIAMYDSSGAAGDLYYRDSSGNFVRLAAGTDGNVLKQASGLPSWGTINGSYGATTKFSNYTISSTDTVIFANAALGNTTITLPTASSLTGYKFYIKRTDSSSNTVTIARTGSDTIDGMISFTLDLQYTAFGVVSNGASWYIL